MGNGTGWNMKWYSMASHGITLFQHIAGIAEEGLRRFLIWLEEHSLGYTITCMA
jgi:hypothetical protein